MAFNGGHKKKSLAAIAWDGVTEPCAVIDFDAEPEFVILLFNYSGNGKVPACRYDLLVNKKTEFKGHLLHELHTYLKDHDSYEYIGIIDDDIRAKISDINLLLLIAGENGLDACQPSLTHDSYHSFEFNLHKPGVQLSWVPWVEIMCPFYRKKLFDACYPLCEKNISSYGIDKYAIPFYQQLLNMKSTAVVHAVQVTHTKSVTDGDKRFSNGLTARQEGEGLRKTIRRLINTKYGGAFPEEWTKLFFGTHANLLHQSKARARLLVKDIHRLWKKI